MKEQSKLGSYFDFRDKKFKTNNGMNDLMQAGLKCQENKFANKNSMAQEKQTSKLDMSKNKVKMKFTNL